MQRLFFQKLWRLYDIRGENSPDAQQSRHCFTIHESEEFVGGFSIEDLPLDTIHMREYQVDRLYAIRAKEKATIAASIANNSTMPSRLKKNISSH